MIAPQIFDRHVRRLRRDRMLSFAANDRWIIARMAQEAIERLGSVKRDFHDALIIGSDFGLLKPALIGKGISVTNADPGARVALSVGGIQCDEDRLPFEQGAFDLVIALGTLDSVDDLPGALIQIRRSLSPDGLFLGAMMGAGGLPLLKSIFADIVPGTAHVHPQIDVRATGDLLARAGFVLPVADTDIVSCRYAHLGRLIADLRANGQTNVLTTRRRLNREDYCALVDRFDASDRLEAIALVYMTAWSPAAK